MTTQRKTEITRYEVATVSTASPNTYGDMIFTDTMGNSHKIGVKRKNLFGAIIPGRAIKLGYAVYNGNEYIASAELYAVDLKIPQTVTIRTNKESTPETKPALSPQSTMAKEDWAEKDRITRKSIERQTSLNAAVELAKAGIIKPEQVIPSARKFEEYLEGKEVQPAKSRIAEAAKAMGAKSIDEEDILATE